MPLDVTRVHLQLMRNNVNNTNRSNSGIFSFMNVMRAIVRQDGVTALFRGSIPAALRQSICGGVGVGIYPRVRDALHRAVHREEIYDHTSASSSSSSSLSQQKKDVKISILERILAGGSSGVLGQFLAAPTDVLKIRLQAQQQHLQQPQYTSCSSAAPPSPRQYKGVIDATKRIWIEEGGRAFFKGLTPSLGRAACMYGTSIATYDTVKATILIPCLGHEDVLVHVLSSLCSGFVAAVISCPFDVIKTRLIDQRSTTTVSPSVSTNTLPHQTQPAHAHHQYYKGPLDVLLKTVRYEGPSALYKGFVPTYLRLAPWQLVFFVSFEQLSLRVVGHTFART